MTYEKYKTAILARKKIKIVRGKNLYKKYILHIRVCPYSHSK